MSAKIEGYRRWVGPELRARLDVMAHVTDEQWASEEIEDMRRLVGEVFKLVSMHPDPRRWEPRLVPARHRGGVGIRYTVMIQTTGVIYKRRGPEILDIAEVGRFLSAEQARAALVEFASEAVADAVEELSR